MNPNTRFCPSDTIISRDIMDRLVLVPIKSGMSDNDDAIFAFNETGATVWKCIEQKKSVTEICECVANEFDSTIDIIEAGVISLLETLLEKQMITKWEA